MVHVNCHQFIEILAFCFARVIAGKEHRQKPFEELLTQFVITVTHNDTDSAYTDSGSEGSTAN